MHDLLLRLGDLTATEIDARSRGRRPRAPLDDSDSRAAGDPVNIAGEPRLIPVEYASRYRDALGVPLPPGLPEALLEPAPNAAPDLARRYARTHAPFTTAEFAARYGARPIDRRGHAEGARGGGRLLEGEFRPGGTGREWCDPDVLQIDPPAVAGAAPAAGRAGRTAGARPADHARGRASCAGARPRRAARCDREPAGRAAAASILETEILPARVEGYQPADLDALTAAGEVVWGGIEPLGERDGRLALYLTDHLARLRREPTPATRRASGAGAGDPRSPRAARRVVLRGAARGGRRRLSGRNRRRALEPGVDAARSPTTRFHARARVHTPAASAAAASRPRSRPSAAAGVAPPAAEGRWSLVGERVGRDGVRRRSRPTALAQQLLSRYGVLTREVAGGRGHLRRLQRRLRRAEGDRGRRADPPRLFRRRRRRDAVRAAGGARSAALAARDRRTSRKSSCSPPPIRPIRTARCCRWPERAVR